MDSVRRTLRLDLVGGRLGGEAQRTFMNIVIKDIKLSRSARRGREGWTEAKHWLQLFLNETIEITL